MRISNLTLGPVDTNTYFIENDKNIIIVDPAAESGQIIQKVNQINKTVKAVVLTHAHFDHIGALTDIDTNYNVPVSMH
ncbi:MBL fold metallo-hydrolase, partial [Staphylococcus arlettae]|uniref:MBL fold metallo-hydrolase n=1 Tax=Staphylococcus arlettae TaxID=29378 RepID=UPI000FF130D8